MSSERRQRGEPIDVWVEVQHESFACWSVQVHVRRHIDRENPFTGNRDVYQRIDDWGTFHRPTRAWALRAGQRELERARHALSRETEHEVIR